MRILLLVPALAAVALGSSPASVLPIVPAAAVTPAASVIEAAQASGDPDDFTFSSFDAQYELDVDADGRSVLRVVETLVAEFPETDQNRGISRVLPTDYDGHPTDLEVLSVEDENGARRAYEEDDGDDALELTIADGDHYVTGMQTYVISYEQHNVTRYFEDTAADEFYRDTNGVEWEQPFDSVTATVELTPALTSRLTGEVDAASGPEGADGPADIESTGNGFRFSAEDLGPEENLSFSIGFEEGTFVPRDSSFAASPWPLAALIAAIIAVLTAVGAYILRRTRLRDAPSRGAIVAQYSPPEDAGVLLSSVISGTTGNATTAEILALAVAGNLRIVEDASGRKPSYRLEYLTDRGADADGREFLHALFGSQLTEGESRGLDDKDAKATSRVSKLMSRVTAAATTNGYRRGLPTGWIVLVGCVAVLATVAAFVFSILALTQAYGGALPGVFLVIGILFGVAAVVLVLRHPLDEKGVELRDHLRGLKQFIEIAEADRIRYLQSPEGAERSPARSDTSWADDEAQVVELNERLLPYAVLFGQEKRWIEELGRHYENLGTSPYWYYGASEFNAAIFASGLNSVTTSVSSSYSSSGGSTGGTVSGGGGGGGGGGGV